MKRFILFTFSILLTFTVAIAQDGINYQGAATDVNGDELTNQNISIRASVLSTSANGNLEWEETHSATTDQFGLFNVVIGQGTNTTNGATATFDDMDWGSGNHFLKIEMDATGGTNYAMIGTTQMMSVPYALYAKSAGSNTTIDSLSQVVSNLDSLMGIITPFFGCTDPTACNYDSNAVIDNGFCSGLLGCTDNQASNYNTSATCDDGTCIPYVGMYGYGGVVYKVSGNAAFIVNVHDEFSGTGHTAGYSYCNGLNTNGYNDWQLPSIIEFEEMCLQKALINIVANAKGGLSFGLGGSYSDGYMSTSNHGSCKSVNYQPKPYYFDGCYPAGFSTICYQPYKLRAFRSFTF